MISIEYSMNVTFEKSVRSTYYETYLLAVDHLMVKEEEDPVLGPAARVHFHQLTRVNQFWACVNQIRALEHNQLLQWADSSIQDICQEPFFL